MLACVVAHLPPEESISKLKLWSVSKNFKFALDIASEAQLAEAENHITALQDQITQIEAGKSYGLLRSAPSIESCKAIMLDKKHIDSLRQIKAPTDVMEKVMGLWLLLLDSFGFEVIGKVQDKISDALKANKDQRVSLFAKGIW